MIETFYDALAEDYHLLFPDWRASVAAQGNTLHSLISKLAQNETKTLLDCACGIGTQAIGLALCGYSVRGTDLSPGAVRRAIREAQSFGIEAEFSVADLRDLPKILSGR